MIIIFKTISKSYFHFWKSKFPIFDIKIKRPKQINKINKKYNINGNPIILSFLPGSRQSEIIRTIPVFIRVMEDLKKKFKKNVHVLLCLLPQLRKHVSNDKIRQELLKMLKNKYKMNSFVNPKNLNESNILINTIRKWWIEDSYELGLNKCMNKIEALVVY